MVRPANSQLLDFAVGGFQYLEAQAVFFDDLTRPGDSSDQGADQSAYGGGFLLFQTHFKKVLQTVDIEASPDNKAVAFRYDLFGGFVLVVNLANDLFHQVAQGH